MFSSDSVCLSVCLSVCVHAATRQSDIWALNVNSSKTVKAIHFRFDAHVSRSIRTCSLKFLGKGAWPWSRDLRNCWALNAYSSKMNKDAQMQTYKI